MRYKGFVCVWHSWCGHWQKNFLREKRKQSRKSCAGVRIRLLWTCSVWLTHGIFKSMKLPAMGAVSLTGGALMTTLPFPVTELRQEGALLGRPEVMGRHSGLQDNSMIKSKLLFFWTQSFHRLYSNAFICKLSKLWKKKPFHFKLNRDYHRVRQFGEDVFKMKIKQYKWKESYFTEKKCK